MNDDSLANDVYCSAVGSSTNLGISSNAPKRGLQQVIDSYSLRGGDTVYVDTGDYTTNVTVSIGVFDSGTPGNPVRIIGSPNGSTLNRGSTSADVLNLAGSHNLLIENLRLMGGRYGLNDGVSNLVVRNVLFIGNRWGVYVSGVGHVFENCVAADNTVAAFLGAGTGENRWLNGVMWNSPTMINVPTNRTLAASNSIFGVGTTLFGNRAVPGNYNLVWNIASAGAGWAKFTDLQASGEWTNSVYADPLFANAGGGDFHVRSAAGRYAGGSWVTDAVHSPAIDLGNPWAAVGAEPMPNGGRLNAGAYGGTAQASKSRTNAWIQLANYTDGAVLDAQAGAWIRWNVGQAAPGATVTIWLSRDNGGSWVKIATNVNAAARAYFWQILEPDNTSSRESMLRVELDGVTPAAVSQSPTNFIYRNGTFSFYVNDTETAGDVYCTAPGNDANSGTSPGAPMRNLHVLLAKLGQLGAGDRVYVDTGVYTATNAITLTAAFSGPATNPVVIAGSPNRAAGGSVFRSTGNPRPMGFDFRAGASNLIVRDIVLSNVVRGVTLSNAVNVVLDGVEVRGATFRAFEILNYANNLELIHCVAHGGGTGVYLNQATNIYVRHGVYWNNTANAIYVGAGVGVQVENSVLASTVSGAALYSVGVTNGFESDYNNLFVGPRSQVGAVRAPAATADSLVAWQRLLRRDIHSLPQDPLLADPERFDYHPKTVETLGRVLPNGERTSDTVTSPLIDAGNPASDFSAEPMPNGGRVNIGRHGGTAEASLTPSLPWIQPLTLADGGGVSNGMYELVWTVGGFSNETARVDVTLDGGKTWGVVVTSGVPLMNGSAVWTVTNVPDTPAALWRLTCLQNTNHTAQTTNFFAIRNQPLNIYVATADTNEAIYVTAPGMADNWRATPDAPLDSVRRVFERFDLEPGDRVWVDTGVYAEDEPIVISLKNSGTSNNPVRIIGNTNRTYLDTGTVLKRAIRSGNSYVFHLTGAQGVSLESLMVSNAWTAIYAENSQGISLERVRGAYCVSNVVYAGANTWMDVNRTIVEGSLNWGLTAFTGSTVKVRHSYLHGNRANLFRRGGTVDIRNSILEASGQSAFAYYLTGGTLVSDFNNIRALEGASVAGGENRLPDRFLIDWQTSTAFANDNSSFGYAPEFADKSGLDFHLKSEAGRFDPQTKTWVVDELSSKLIDLGDPASSYANEPAPNGGRVNVGLYGNTTEASKSEGGGALVPLTMSDGGTVRGTVKLYWSWNGLAPNRLLNVQFSADGGVTWTNIATGVYADVGSSGLEWATTNFPSTGMGVWRVMTTNEPPLIGQTENLFAVKNDPLTYYVNDGNTNGDVYCTAIGRASNDGATPDTPIDSLTRLLGRYKIEPGDTIYVDTGVYAHSGSVNVSVNMPGNTNWLVIKGSTNEAAGGTIFTNTAGGTILQLANSSRLDVRDVNLHGPGTGLRLDQSSFNKLTRVRVVGSRANAAIELSMRSDQNEFIQCAALGVQRTGLVVVAAVGPQTPLTTNFWTGGVIASVPADSNGVAVSTGALVSVTSGRLYVSNSVMVAAGPTHSIYAVAPGAIQGDYNCYYKPSPYAWAEISGGAPVFGVAAPDIVLLQEWQEWSQGDANSFVAEPLFADLAAGDLHPLSAGGRYVPTTGEWVWDYDTSPLIDTADPTMPYGNEPAPNGNRANIGVYGNSAFASRTPSNGTFVLLTLNDGGVVRGNYTLKWVARGGATNIGHNVNVRLSTNSGASWMVIGSTVASNGQFVLASTNYPTLPTARWSLQSQQQPTWQAATEKDFTIHNSSITYYVNDGSTSNDVYTTAVGKEGNTGLTPSSPLPSLRAVLERYNLEPGDQVLMDTGTYPQTSSMAIGYRESGTVGDPVSIIGSTHDAGTTFTGAGVQFSNARGMAFRNVRFDSQVVSSNVVAISRSENILLSQVDVLSSQVNGISIERCSNVFLKNFLVANVPTNGVSSLSSYNTCLEFGTIWSNGTAQIISRNQPVQNPSTNFDVSYMTVSNCVIGSFGIRRPAYEIRGNLYANYNNIYLSGGALAGLSYEAGFAREFDSVGSWACSEYGQDRMSLSHDPRFADVQARDFHLRSSAGRYNPATGEWVHDPAGDNSPLIDAGDPALACTEPMPNGGRVNIGRYGNTFEASKTPTNGALTLISFNNGGRAVGTEVPITWLVRGATTGATVSIYFSADGRSSWTLLTNGIAATAGEWIWDSTLSEQTVQGALKIVSDGPDGAEAQSSTFFAVRNRPFYFYINDNSTVGDVYCTAVGNNQNSGLTNSAPMADLNSLLAKYDLEGGDVVYIDTGRYTGVNPWRITQADSGGSLDAEPVIIQGSTNSLANGTVLDRQLAPTGIQVDYAVGLLLRNITVSNVTGSAVAFNQSYNVGAEWMVVGNGDVGFRLTGGEGLRVAHSLVMNSKQALIVEGISPLATNFPVIENNVFWETGGNTIQVSGEKPVYVHNNILSAGAGHYIYDLGDRVPLIADYNAIWLGAGARVLRRTVPYDDNPLQFTFLETVGAWVNDSGQDVHSYDGDPMVVNPAAKDFHLRSQAGRWDPVALAWTNDLSSSPLIDAGMPTSASWTNEPIPNGGRVNIGLYGGTEWASKTATNSALYLLSWNNGGVVTGQVMLTWRAAGLATNHTVRLDVSPDNGDTWVRVADGLPATLGGVAWNSLSMAPTPVALWRVQDEVEEDIEAISAVNFVVHNGPIAYYVNDESTDGDIYCSAAGSASGTGRSPDSPMLWISDVLSTYNVGPGDRIYVDTGRYYRESPTVFRDVDAGAVSQNPAEQVNVIGSTNSQAGGSLIIVSDPNVDVFMMTNTTGIRLQHLTMTGARHGLDLRNSYFIAADWLDIRNGENGLWAQMASNIVVSHSVFMGHQNAGIWLVDNNKGTMNVGSSVLWSNRYGIYVQQGYATVSNSILAAVRPDSFGFYRRTDTGQVGIQSDYNSLYSTERAGGVGGLQSGSENSARTTAYFSVSTWSAATGQDKHSLAHDPHLADPGRGDFHLKSAGGRYVPATDSWVYDGVSSPLIDAGTPHPSAWVREPDPNGRRLNIGLYGGTPEASKTPVSGWVTVLSLNDGGSVQGDVQLQWAAGGAATNYTVCLEYSPDAGITWTNIVCGWPANLGEYLWDSVPYGRSAQGMWRMYCEQDLNIYAQSLLPFLLRNGGTIPFYVNDTNTVGDVYCTAPGNDNNNGLTPATPKATVQAILREYELAPEDVVYVDAGAYSISAPIVIDQYDSGWSNLFVTIQGSTNPAARTEFWGASFSVPAVFSLQYAENVRLKDLTIRNGGWGIAANESLGCELVGVRVENNRGGGISLNRTFDMRAINSILWKNSSPTGGAGVAISQGSMTILNSVLWDHPVAVSIGAGSMNVTNSVLSASGTGGRIYQLALAASPITGLCADYNAYHRINGALICEKRTQAGGNDYYNDLPNWSLVTSNDLHSMTLSPEFADDINGDFHPKSSQGRFVPGQGWTNDVIRSPLIDAGDPAYDNSREPDPNGGLINIGAYGNTAQASKTPTNAPWLQVVALNEGGLVTADVLLTWLYGGMPSNSLVRLEYSTDYEMTWTVIASNLTVGARQYAWDISGMPLTLALNWRVVLESNPNIFDVSDQPVAIKTRTYEYYINDDSTEGDVWCTAPGHEWDYYTAYGTNASTPLNSLKALLEHYPVSAGDTIYVDTGVYPVSSSNCVQFTDMNMGSPDMPLVIYGSTNDQAGGALLQGNGTASGLSLQNTRYIEINNLRVTGAHHGLHVQNVDNLIMRGMRLYNNMTNGVALSGSANIKMANSLLFNNGQFGYSSAGGLGVQTLENVTIWGNRAGAAENAQGTLNIFNSILAVTNTVAINCESGRGRISGDYNLFYSTEPGYFIGTNAQDRVGYAKLRQWQAGGRDWHSQVAKPYFVDAARTNFHLQSRVGYWSNGTWAVASNTSWAIDAGDPASTAYTNEPMPNGNRLNLGAYGGTARASRSDTNAPGMLQAVSFSDGGIALYNDPFYWLFRGLSPTNTVRLEYSPDAGLTWIVMDAGLRIDSAPYNWDSQQDPSPEAQWQVILEGNTNIYSRSTNFMWRPRPLTYYVNDDSQDGDVYTTAIGESGNRGYTADSPLPTIQDVLARYQLLSGDEIKVDTGEYVLTNTVFISSQTSGSAVDPVRFTASTNYAVGGARLYPDANMGDPAFTFHSARNVTLQGFRIVGFTNGVSMQEYTANCLLTELDIQGSWGAAVSMSKATDIQLQRVLIREGEADGLSVSQGNVELDSSVIWTNRGSAVYLGQGARLGMTNSVLAASGLGTFCYFSPTTTVIQADYNNLYLTNRAQLASINGEQFRQLPQWQTAFRLDRSSLSTDPVFADADNGDFHLRSVTGRYRPGVGWVQDVHDDNLPDFSPMIDMGFTNAWANEPAPNGGRRNIGLYGNTAEASKSNTNRWLQAVTAMSGGLLSGSFNLIWGYGGGLASNEMVRIEYSYDNGISQWLVVGDTTVGKGQFYWYSDQLELNGDERYPSSPSARWKIYLLSDTNVWDMTDWHFGLRNSPFKFYVNDESTVGDIYCTAPGNDANLGTYPAAPKLTLQGLLGAEEIDLEPTDQVLVDTGRYYMEDTNNPIRWDMLHSGVVGEPVYLYGSTNPAGSVFVASNRFSTGGFFFMEADFVEMHDVRFEGEAMQFIGNGLVVSNLSLTNGNMTILGNNSTFRKLYLDRGALTFSGRDNLVDGYRQRWGESSLVGTNIVLQHAAIYTTGNMRTGLFVQAVGAVVSNSSVLATRGTALGKRGSGLLRMGHNILVAGGQSDENKVIAWEDGALISDWNNLLARDSAWVGTRKGKWEKLAYWQLATGQDANSVSIEPIFQNEATGDLHLNSTVGRWSPIFNNWDVDGNHSPVIDLGDPWIGTGEEIWPNGYRRNLGAYGGTVEASKSTTNFWLTALSYNDGGVLKGSNVVLRWAAGNAGTHTVRLQYFDGQTWHNIATGIDASQGQFVWDTTGFPDSFSGRWRVQAEDGSVSDETDRPFALRNGNHVFYVNDADQTGDIYCTAPGAATNNGLTKATPMLSLQALLDTYDLEGGDVVLMDTGFYAITNDVRMIWSRSGTATNPVVIQGNTNGPHTQLQRTGATNYPAVILDVKASHVDLQSLYLRDADRGILLESNRNIRVRDVVVRGGSTGIAVENAMETEIRNSAFWQNAYGIGLNNTRTSVLENLTFALPTSAGIRLNGTVKDTMQNNIFIPEEGAYAYAIGSATSLLSSAVLDYNLYDFGRTNSGFFDGATNVLRRWQLGMKIDYRSAITDANLANLDMGDFHPLSAFGRWTPGGWVTDDVTSWAVDHGNPTQDASLEPAPNGERLNVGMYGNTLQASKGSQDTYYEIRSLDEPDLVIEQSDLVWPLVWSAHEVASDEWVLVQFSADGGQHWTTLTNAPAYLEYYIWQINIQHQTTAGRWRVIGVNDPTVLQESDNLFRVRFKEFERILKAYSVDGLLRFDWEGGIPGRRYIIEYSDDFGETWNTWDPKYNGPAFINKSNFIIPTGQSQLSYTFEDRTSYLRKTRWYRMWEIVE
ncbi:MAG: right-handed parallel beta-helix repeat-containing protein [Kiritimatiellia bacterium]